MKMWDLQNWMGLFETEILVRTILSIFDFFGGMGKKPKLILVISVNSSYVFWLYKYFDHPFKKKKIVNSKKIDWNDKK